jgi:hypothetical protein
VEQFLVHHAGVVAVTVMPLPGVARSRSNVVTPAFTNRISTAAEPTISGLVSLSSSVKA